MQRGQHPWQLGFENTPRIPAEADQIALADLGHAPPGCLHGLSIPAKRVIDGRHENAIQPPSPPDLLQI
eukprot:3946982-Lingulodinium_polyedra.AAC.1